MLRWTKMTLAAVMVLLTVPAVSAERSLKMYYFASTRGIGVGEATNAFVKRVNEKGKGLIQIQAPLLDPASIPTPQVGNALKNGIVDIAVAPPGYFSGLVPGAEGLTANTVTPAEQRRNGAFDLVNAQFEKRMNAHYLAQVGYGTKFHIFTTVPVKTLDDFKGMRLRSSRTYKAFFEAIGAQPVLISRGETFTALERGVVKGYGNIETEIKQAGWADITKFKIEPGFYDALVVAVVNLKTWNALDGRQQAVLKEAAVWFETDGNNEMQHATASASKDLEKHGIKTLMLPAEQGKKYVELANKATWDNIVKQAPDFGPALKKLIFP